MRRSRTRIAWLIGVAAVPATTGAAQAQTLYDRMKNPASRAAFAAMWQGAKAPAWVQTFMRTGNGVTAPGKRVGGYEAGWVCKPHDCGDNQLRVLFTTDGTRAYGLLIEGDRKRLVGAPDARARAILDDEANF